MKNETHCGYVALVGRPNVGKSTLLNNVLGQKISITSRKPQTTRYQILGVKTLKNQQIIFVDTPGLHDDVHGTMNRYMNRAARHAIQDVDVVLFIVETYWTERDEWVLQQLKKVTIPVFLVINKTDQIKDYAQLLPFIEKMSVLREFKHIIPVSAKTGDHVDVLEQSIINELPSSPFYFPIDQVTDRSEQFIVSEIIREKLMRLLGQEIPYSLAVTIVAIKEDPKIIRISAVIWVERKGQKGIVIGKDGNLLKKIGTNARLDIEKQFSKKVFLQLWVKVKNGWSDSERLLQELGFEE